MLYQTIIYELSFSEFPGDKPLATSYPERDGLAPLNPNSGVPGTDSPGVGTGSGMNPDKAEQDHNSDKEWDKEE